MHIPLPQEVGRDAYVDRRETGATHEEAVQYASHMSSNMGWIYGTLMVLPAKVIVLIGFAIMVYTSWWDGMTGPQRMSMLFGLVWAYWFAAVWFTLKLKSRVLWAIYLLVHVLLGGIVISAMGM